MIKLAEMILVDIELLVRGAGRDTEEQQAQAQSVI